MFQSTHPRGVRRPQDGVGPAAGALVSIHAPAWGATSLSCNIPPRRGGFQSTHPRGVRQQHGDAARDGFVVSIHAPAWGATALVRRMSVRALCFNPRTRVGCDWAARSPPRWPLVFQSTHPRGVRPMRTNRFRRFFEVSIHAPAWGATPDAQARVILWGVQSTHPRGVRHMPESRLVWAVQVSIHAPAWGATFSGMATGPRPLCFNPRTRVGCDRTYGRPRSTTSCFNPRTRVGCDMPAPIGAILAFTFQSTHPREVRP